MRFSSFRQLKYSPEFRIKPASLSEEDIENLYEFLMLLPKSISAENVEINDSSQEQSNSEKLLKTIADLIVNNWRMQQKIEQLNSNNKIEEDSCRRLLRFLSNFKDIIESNDFEISDHANEINTGGETYKVIAYQPEESFIEERVIETIKPTIYFKNKILQRGEVIVGKPKES